MIVMQHIQRYNHWTLKEKEVNQPLSALESTPDCVDRKNSTPIHRIAATHSAAVSAEE